MQRQCLIQRVIEAHITSLHMSIVRQSAVILRRYLGRVPEFQRTGVVHRSATFEGFCSFWVLGEVWMNVFAARPAFEAEIVQKQRDVSSKITTRITTVCFHLHAWPHSLVPNNLRPLKYC